MGIWLTEHKADCHRCRESHKTIYHCLNKRKPKVCSLDAQEPDNFVPINGKMTLITNHNSVMKVLADALATAKLHKK